MAYDNANGNGKGFRSHYTTDRDVIFSSERTATGEYSFVKVGFGDQAMTMNFSKGGGSVPAKDAFLKLSYETATHLLNDLVDIAQTRQNQYVKKEQYQDFEIKYEFGFKDKQTNQMRKTGILTLKTKMTGTGFKAVTLVYTAMDTNTEYEIILGITFLADSYTNQKPGFDVHDARFISLMLKMKSIIRNWMVLQQNASNFFVIKKMLDSIGTKLGITYESKYAQNDGGASYGGSDETVESNEDSLGF